MGIWIYIQCIPHLTHCTVHNTTCTVRIQYVLLNTVLHVCYGHCWSWTLRCSQVFSHMLICIHVLYMVHVCTSWVHVHVHCHFYFCTCRMYMCIHVQYDHGGRKRDDWVQNYACSQAFASPLQHDFTLYMYSTVQHTHKLYCTVYLVLALYSVLHCVCIQFIVMRHGVFMYMYIVRAPW